MSDKVSGGGVLTRTKRVYLRSGTANEGYAVCYNYDAVGVTAENDSISVNTAITDWCDARRVMVEVPSSINNLHFAGVVDHASDGVVGPNWILIHQPGSICKIHTDANISVRGATATAYNQAAMLTFTVGVHSANSFTTINGMFKFQGLPGEGSAWVLEEAAATANIMAQLMTGPPSGGVQAIGTNATITALAVNSDLPLIHHGKVVTSTCNLDVTIKAAISVPRAQTHHFVGQRLVFDAAGFANTTAAIHAIHFSSTIILSTVTAVHDASMTTAVTSAACSVARYFDFQWNGTAWLLTSSNATAVQT